MVLGSIDKSITYPKSIYYSAQPWEFGYLEKTLMLEPPSWDDETNEWLASLFGMVYLRELPDRNTDPDKAWADYLNRIEAGLKAGSAVQTSRGWLGMREENGHLVSKIGGHVFWWEGLSKKNRPDMHYSAIVGLDRDKGTVYIHDPILGWYGWGKDTPMPLKAFRKAVERAPWQHRYITITFRPGNEPAKTGAEMERLLRERITKKIKGDPSVYNSVDMWSNFFGKKHLKRNFTHGIAALKAFKTDLQPDRFKKILLLRKQRANMDPSSVVSWLDLNIYHKAWITLIGAEYLEERGRTNDWNQLMQLHILYEKLWTSTSRLRAIFKKNNNIETAMQSVTPILRSMQNTLDDLIRYNQNLLKSI